MAINKVKFTKRKRLPGEVLPAKHDLFTRPVYKPGQGEVIQPQRPGSDHSHIKSRGNPT